MNYLKQTQEQDVDDGNNIGYEKEIMMMLFSKKISKQLYAVYLFHVQDDDVV